MSADWKTTTFFNDDYLNDDGTTRWKLFVFGDVCQRIALKIWWLQLMALARMYSKSWTFLWCLNDVFCRLIFYSTEEFHFATASFHSGSWPSSEVIHELWEIFLHLSGCSDFLLNLFGNDIHLKIWTRFLNYGNLHFL